MLNTLMQRFDILQILTSALVLFTCIPFHEFAHGFVAKKCGDNTAERAGRLTLNPMAHLNLWGSLALVFFGFGWANPVPVDSSKLNNPKRDMGLVAAAGPASNVLLSIIVLIPYQILNGYYNSLPPLTSVSTVQTLDIILSILGFLVQINLWLAVFNLLPVLPFDGGNILASLLPEKWNRKLYQFSNKYRGVITVAVLILLSTGLLTVPLRFLSNLILRFLLFATNPLTLIF